MTEQETVEIKTQFFFNSFISFAKKDRKDSIEVVKEIHTKLEEEKDCKELFEILLCFYEVKNIHFSKKEEKEWSRIENLIIIYLNSSIGLISPNPEKTSKSFLEILGRYRTNSEEFPRPVSRVMERKIEEIGLYEALHQK
ncbi:MAG: hypothetical protein WDZ80_02770 [Candidatus Paceibacterota bacterium]